MPACAMSVVSMRFMVRNRAGKGMLSDVSTYYPRANDIGEISYNTRQARSARFESAITAASSSAVGEPSPCWADDCLATSAV